MSRNIEDLRNHLFSALDGLADEKKPLAIERAKAIADVARVIVDSAKAEIQLLQATGAKQAATQFLPLIPAATEPRRLESGGCPSCGARMRPETNGKGTLVDRCTNCNRVVPAAPAVRIAK